MPNLINLLIDEKSVQVPEGTTILKAARSMGIDIPTICFHDYCTSNALCRICVVEVDGSRTLVASCVAKVTEGMQVHTQTERVRLARRAILEMLASSVDLSEAPDILAYIREYGADVQRFPQAEKRDPPLIDDNPMYIRDYAKCILCWRCVQVCAADAQYTYAINFSSRGYKTSIGTFYDRPMPETTCVFCGQCVGVCPTGALKPKREWLLEEGLSEPQIMDLTRSERKSKRQRPEGGVR
jgi:NADH dehydrogenase/NADH:ubiquinone oxidoreductase subunit G